MFLAFYLLFGSTLMAPPGGLPSAREIATLCSVAADGLATEGDTSGIVNVGSPAVLIVSGAGHLTDGRLNCLGHGTAANGISMVNFALAFEDATLRTRYDAIVQGFHRLAARRFLEEAHQSRRMPRRNPGEPLPAFALRLERFCDAEPGSVLKVTEDRMEARPGSMIVSRGGGLTFGPFICATSAATLAGFDPQLSRHAPTIASSRPGAAALPIRQFIDPPR